MSSTIKLVFETAQVTSVTLLWLLSGRVEASEGLVVWHHHTSPIPTAPCSLHCVFFDVSKYHAGTCPRAFALTFPSFRVALPEVSTWLSRLPHQIFDLTSSLSETHP